MGTFARIIRSQVTLFVAAVMLLPTQVLADFDLLLPMSESGGGSYTIPGRFGDAPRTPFLVDTGAAITTISSRLFRKLERSRDLKPVRRRCRADGERKTRGRQDLPHRELHVG